MNTEITYEQNQETKKPMIIPILITLISAIMLALTFFLPYASATKNKEQYLKANPNGMYIEEINMKNKEAVRISMFEFGKIYAAGSKIEALKVVGTIGVVLISMIGVFTLMTLLFALLKKPIPVLVFNILNFLTFSILSWDFKDRGVVPSNTYNWGIGYYLYYIVAIAILVGTIMMIKAKKRQDMMH